MFDDHEDYGEDVIGSPPPWLHLLSAAQRAWRESQILKGRNPDPYIEDRLRESGAWADAATASDRSDP